MLRLSVGKKNHLITIYLLTIQALVQIKSLLYVHMNILSKRNPCEETLCSDSVDCWQKGCKRNLASIHAVVTIRKKRIRASNMPKVLIPDIPVVVGISAFPFYRMW